VLLPRLLTALIGMPLLVFFIHWGSIPFTAFMTGAAVLALHEFGIIASLGGRGIQRSTVTVGGGLLALAAALAPPGGGLGSMGSAAALTLLILTAVLRETFREERSLDRAALTVFGAVFIGWTLAHIPLLRDLRPHGERLTFFLFIAVWVTDIAAYAVGMTAGRRPLAPSISPKKTWEGAAGGLAAALLFSLIAGKTFLSGVLGTLDCLEMGLIIGTLGQVSDLSESFVKRSAGVKDSSSLLPGHGGILDRFDSFLLTAPAIYYALYFKLYQP